MRIKLAWTSLWGGGWLAGGASLAVFFSACHLVGGYSDFDFDAAPSTAGGGATATGGSAAAGGSVGGGGGAGASLPTGEHIWSKRFGDSTDQSGTAIAAAAGGDIVVAGHFKGTIDIGNPLQSTGDERDIFVAKLDPSGQVVWSKGFGGNDRDTVNALALSASTGHVYMTGSFESDFDFGGPTLTHQRLGDIFLAKLSSGGAHEWSGGFGSTGIDGPDAIAVDSASSVFFAGDFRKEILLGVNKLVAEDMLFYAKVTAGGTHEHSFKFGTDGISVDQEFAGLAVDSADNVWLAGHFSEKIDLGGDELTSAGGRDIFVAKLTSSGDHIYSVRFGDGKDQFVNAIAVDEDDNVVLLGNFDGSVSFGGPALSSKGGISNGNDVFVAKLDQDGKYLWDAGFGDENPQFATAVAVDHNGNIVLTGALFGSVDFGGGALDAIPGAFGASDIYLVKLAANGAHIWSKRFGDEQHQQPGDVTIDGAGNIILTGVFAGSLDLGGDPLICQGGVDVFIAKFGP